MSDEPKTVQAAANAYHAMIRQALVDFGDHIIDTLADHFKDAPKMLQMLEKVREEELDPLRVGSS